MLHRKTRSRSWKGVAVLGALPHFVRCVCQVPTSFQRSYATAYAHPAPLRCHFPCPPLAEAGLAREISAESDGAKGTKQEFVGRWAECVGICYFQTVGSASALSEHTSRSEAVNLVSATHFHERERVWKWHIPIYSDPSPTQNTCNYWLFWYNWIVYEKLTKE